MKANVGGADKIIRIIVGIVLVSLVFVGPKTQWGWIGLIPLLTGLLSWCPLYQVIGFSSCKKG